MKQPGGGQRSIASFFTKAAPHAAAGTGGGASQPGKAPAAVPAGRQGSTAKSPQLTDQTNVPAEPKHKRLRRTIEDDTPEKQAEQKMELEDDVEMPAPVAPARRRSPTKPASPAAATAAAAAAAAAAAPGAPAAAPASGSKPAAAVAPAAAVPPQPAPAARKRRSSKPATRDAAAGNTSPASSASSADPISFTASSGSGAAAAGDVGAEVQSGVKRLKRSDDTVAKKKGKAGSKVEGVGAVALQEAQRAAAADIPAMITWGAGDPVPYAFLADTFEAISQTTKRLEMTSILTNCFRAILGSTPQDLLPAVSLCVNQVADQHKGIELGVGEGILTKALSDSTGRNEAALKKDYKAAGDLGKVAMEAKATQRTLMASKPLTIRGVFQAFKAIAACSGASSQEKKRSMIVKLLVDSKKNEAGYVMRSLQGKLRIGLADQSVLVALAHAVLLHQQPPGKDKAELAHRMEEAAQAVKGAFSECPSYEQLVPALVHHPVWEVQQHCHFMPTVPVKPMLAKPTTGVSEVLDKFSGKEFTCEYKYDGERAQIHVMEGGKKVMIFSRNSEDMTGKYPDITARIPGLLQPGVDSVVLDGEAVGWDPVHKRLLPFQTLSTRARKDVAVKDIKVQVVVFAFDCLYLNGKSLLQEPLTERRKALHEAIKEKEGELQYAVTKTSTDVEELELFLADAVGAATEGLIVKTLTDTYEPSKRSSHWLKLKKDYMEGVGDTFDVVPIGAFYGKGKRTGVFGAYLLAVYDADGDCYQTISKLGTGFSEEQLKELADSLRPHIIPTAPRYYRWSDTLEPDVWFDPVKVWEVKAADLSISPVHRAAAGLVDPDKGISIRFPRLVRIRDDKGPEDTTSPMQIAEMYQQQAVVKSRAKKKEEDE